MEIQELLQLCKERNELDFLFQITKIVAETDSVGEGIGYCPNYKPHYFNEDCEYLNHVTRYIYLTYLQHIYNI
jgi:hypothetical protein